MFSLTYTPAYDPNHAIFRYVALLASAKTNSMAARTLRVADFFLCFPWVIKELRVPKGIDGFARKRNALVRHYQPTDYDAIPEPRIVFERMEPIQILAVSAMLGAKIVTRDDSGSEVTSLVKDSISPLIERSANAFISEHSELLSFLTGELTQIGIFGEDGIFSRSGLGEHRYDAV